jgi:hypothetical protein
VVSVPNKRCEPVVCENLKNQNPLAISAAEKVQPPETKYWKNDVEHISNRTPTIYEAQI